MATSQKFCLKWNNFQNSVTSVFENLRQDEELVDITLCCEGQKIKAHRMMLSACSPYFRDLLKENPCQHPVFFLKDTSFPDLSAVVEFVYKGEVNVVQSQLASFLKTAEMLQVKGLSGDDDEDAPGRPAADSSPADRPSGEQRPRHGSGSRLREPPDSPRSKRRRLSGGELRPGTPSPLPPPLPPATIDLEAAPAAPASSLEPPLPHQPPLQAGQQPADDGYGIKVEKVDIADGDDDASLETALGQVSTMEAAQFEGSDHSTSSHDMAGLISRLSEQGGSGDMSMAGTAGTSEDGSSQGGGRRGGVFQHRCELCPRQFRSAIALSTHRAVHRGETRCHLCGVVYCSRWYLRNHLATRHGIPCPPAGATTVAGVRAGAGSGDVSGSGAVAGFGAVAGSSAVAELRAVAGSGAVAELRAVAGSGAAAGSGAVAGFGDVSGSGAVAGFRAVAGSGAGAKSEAVVGDGVLAVTSGDMTPSPSPTIDGGQLEPKTFTPSAGHSGGQS